MFVATQNGNVMTKGKFNKQVQEAQLPQRDSASAMHVFFWARSLIVHFTERRICCTL